MRGRFFNYRAIARVAGFAAVAVAIILADVHLARRTTISYERAHWVAPHIDVLAETLNRCEVLDNATPTEKRKACETAWTENRHRFFGDERASNITTLRAGDLQPIAKPEGR